MTGGPAPELLRLLGSPHPDVAPLPPAAPAGPGVRLLRGVPYAEHVGSRPLELDLWLPDATGAGSATGAVAASVPVPVPVVLYVHGGAWLRGRRDDMGFRTRDWRPGPFARLAASGLAVASVDYRLSGEAPFPAPLEDLRAALRWLTVRSGELGIDTGRAAVWGESAGGHLASLLALTAPDDATDGPADGPVAPPVPPLACAVIWYGPSDLSTPRAPYDPADPGTPESRLLGAPAATVPEAARAASPVSQVRPGAPPFLLVHGDQDSMVSHGHSEELAARLRAAGVPVELRTVPGADHCWYGITDAEVEGVFQHSLRAVVRSLGGRVVLGGGLELEAGREAK